MKGVVFTVFSQLVTEKFGLETWDRLVNDTHPPSQGAYTSAGTYGDQELFGFVGRLSEITGASASDLVFAFGEYLLLALSKRHGRFFQGISFKDFLKSIDQVIHVEVRKLYPDAGLPTIQCEDSGKENQLTLIYNSPRKLCRLAEGLISGAAQHFKMNVQMNHSICMHQGAHACRIELTFEQAGS